MTISLAALAGFSDGDPEFAAARADAVAYADLIEGLVELRRRSRMTQADVAQAMGTTQSVISHFERLGGDARFSTVQRYARAVGAYLQWQASVDGGQTTALFRSRPVSSADSCYQTEAVRSAR